MTTVAWDGVTMAGDTMIVSGDIKGFCGHKVGRLADGTISR